MHTRFIRSYDIKINNFEALGISSGLFRIRINRHLESNKKSDDNESFKFRCFVT